MLLFLLLSNFFFSLHSYSQTELDMLAFEALNEYRIEHGVEPLIFDTAVWRAAQHHSVYLGENGYPYNYVCSSGHLELVLVNFYDRLNHFGVKWVGTGAECVATWGGERSNEDNVIQVIHQWDGSPPHKKGLLKEDVNRMAISIVSISKNCDRYFNYNGVETYFPHTCVNYFATLLLVR